MTNLEFMKSLNAEQLVKFIYHTTDYMCLQRKAGRNANEVWRLRCRNSKYRDIDGCDRCRIDWLNTEMGELEAWCKGLNEPKQMSLDFGEVTE